MITQLYVFSPGSYVVAEEWNANFRALLETNIAHEEAIVDANSIILFQGGDYSAVYARVDNEVNSFLASNTILPKPDCEYYRDLQGADEQITVNVSTGQLNGEARIIIKTSNNRTLTPIVITYNGSQDDVVWPNGIAQWYLAGMKFVFLLERNGKLYVKMIATE
jgi:hypothetical protein